MRVLSNRRPLLNRMVRNQLGIVAIGFLFIFVSIWLLAAQKRQSELNQRRSEVAQRLSLIQERWRSWVLLGLNDALHAEMAVFANAHKLRSLILTANVDQYSNDKTFVWLPEDRKHLISAQDRFILAELQMNQLEFWTYLGEFRFVFIFVAVMLIIVVGYSSYFFRKNIGDPIDRLLSSFERLQPGEKLDLSEVPASGELANLKSEIERIHLVSTRYEKDAALTAIAKQVSHDIRSPLSALNFLANGALQDAPEKRDLMLSAINRINGLANELLDRSVGASPVVDDQSVEDMCDVVKVVRNLVGEKKLEINQCPNINLKIDRLTPQSANTIIRETEFSRILSNMLNNAVESIEDAGTVSVGVRRSAKETHIIIQDTGIGMPPELIEKLGKESFSLGKVNRRFRVGGSGIGMVQAQQIINARGGRLQIQSKPSVGTSITIALPSADR